MMVDLLAALDGRMKRSDISEREALEACWGWGKPSGEGALATLMRLYPQKVAEARLYQLVDKGLIDYGVSIGYPWRTPEGEERLRELVGVRENNQT